tara:strand:- start:440 stop:838 length:399 start_codon:yes stop_codon:yes gene_type:complete
MMVDSKTKKADAEYMYGMISEEIEWLKNVYEADWKDFGWSFTEMFVVMESIGEFNLEDKLTMGNIYDLGRTGKMLDFAKFNLNVMKEHYMKIGFDKVIDFDRYVLLKFCILNGIIELLSMENPEKWNELIEE